MARGWVLLVEEVLWEGSEVWTEAGVWTGLVIGEELVVISEEEVSAGLTTRSVTVVGLEEVWIGLVVEEELLAGLVAEEELLAGLVVEDVWVELVVRLEQGLWAEQVVLAVEVEDTGVCRGCCRSWRGTVGSDMWPLQELHISTIGKRSSYLGGASAGNEEYLGGSAK